MNKMIFALVALTCGCAAENNGAYEQYVETLPTVERIHNSEAAVILASYYGVDVSDFEVHWVSSPIETRTGGEASGVTFDCTSWVYWESLHPAIDPVRTSIIFSNTAMAHEVAHCVLLLQTGDSDSDHHRKDWWYKNGIVDGARAALVHAGY
jgi:hypothetical protein